jgi:predicted nucleotidyltransferase
VTDGTPDPLDTVAIHKLSEVLRNPPLLVFSVLIGSRATGKTHKPSDWDIALQWTHEIEWLTVLAETETLRRTLAQAIGTSESAIDLIDLRRANLAMRAAVAEKGLPLSGDNSPAWARFLRRTWRDLEDFYWDQQHAA